MKEIISEELKERCEEHAIEEHTRFTVVSIANALHISRNTVSQYLNEGVKTGDAIKINSRLVYLFAREAVENKWSGAVTERTFDSFEQLARGLVGDAQDFEQLVGCNDSLPSVVEHCKVAVFYPGGLPTLISGPTDTGKSMIVSIMYEYVVNQNIIGKNKKFVVVNRSEHANNSELLTTNLFGNVKGVYIRADEDNPGLILLADGGLLFPDGVHYSKVEYREKLFLSMDRGMYHRVGDNESWYYSKRRPVFTTTEDPQDILLETLLRRISITITVPALKDRPLIEKWELIYTTFTKESRRLGKETLISNPAYQSPTDFEFIGSVGTLKNAIKTACTNSFLVHQGEPKLRIQVADLSDYIFPSLISMQLKSPARGMQEVMIPIEWLRGLLNQTSPLLHLYNQLVTQCEGYQISTNVFPAYTEKAGVLIQSYIDYVMFHNRYQKNASEAYLLKLLDKIYSIVMSKCSISIPNNETKIYSRILVEYSKCATDANIWISAYQKTMKVLVEEVQERMLRILYIAEEVVENVRLNLDLELDELLLVVIAIAPAGYQSEEVNSCAGAILCHGHSTASSIADTANRMLGQYVFDGIDMEINITIDKVAQLADDYLKRKGTIHKPIFLVDMGSLGEIYTRIKPMSDYNIVLTNNVSTAMALEAGNYIMQGKRVEEISQLMKENHQLSIHYLKSRKKKSAILLIYATGLGAAKKVSEPLKGFLPCKISLEIILYSYQQLVENGNRDSIFNRYQVGLIVGTLDPKVSGIPFMAIESVMTNDGIGVLEQLMQWYLGAVDLEAPNQNITKNFTLSNITNHLTTLNGEEIIDDVGETVENLEEDLNEELDATRKVGLYVHISCLIECLILKQGIEHVEGMEKVVEGEKDRADKVKDAPSGVEMRYSVELPAPEALYVLNYFKNPKQIKRNVPRQKVGTFLADYKSERRQNTCRIFY